MLQPSVSAQIRLTNVYVYKLYLLTSIIHMALYRNSYSFHSYLAKVDRKVQTVITEQV